MTRQTRFSLPAAFVVALSAFMIGQTATPSAQGATMTARHMPENGRTMATSATVAGRFQNGIGGRFQLRRVICSVDGTVTYDQPTGAREVALFDRTLRPGRHSISIVADYAESPDSALGLFEGRHFHLSAGETLYVRPGEAVKVTATSREGGGLRTALGDRLLLTINTADQ